MLITYLLFIKIKVFIFQSPKSLVSSDMSTETAASDSTFLNAGGSIGSSAMLAAVAVGGALLLVLVLASVAVCYIRRRICHVDGKAQPVSLLHLLQPNHNAFIAYPPHIS